MFREFDASEIWVLCYSCDVSVLNTYVCTCQAHLIQMGKVPASNLSWLFYIHTAVHTLAEHEASKHFGLLQRPWRLAEGEQKALQSKKG